MGRHTWWRAVGLGCAAAVVLATVGAPALADDAKSKVSQQYAVWARFKPGSSSTLSADVDMNGQKVTVTVVQTLVSVTPTEATLTITSTMNRAGMAQAPFTQKRVVPAVAGTQEPKASGTADVSAIGKTFHCQVYDMTRWTGPAGPHPGGPARANGKVYAADDVPGGVVKIEAAAAAPAGGAASSGVSMSFLLTAMDVR